MQAASGKSAPTYRTVMDSIKSRLGLETLVRALFFLYRRIQSLDPANIWCPRAKPAGSEDMLYGFFSILFPVLGDEKRGES